MPRKPKPPAPRGAVGAVAASLARRKAAREPTHVASGDVVPRIAATFPLAQIGAAHSLMASDDFFGKIVLTL